MRVSEAKELFRSMTAEYFAGADVIFSRQSRIAKPLLPLVSITPGSVRRHLDPAYRYIDGVPVGYYLSRMSMDIDLFTHGKAVTDDSGNTVAYENTAVDDLLSFMDFLNSQYVIQWCHTNDVAIAFETEAQDLTGIVNDNNYEFRARLSIGFSFTQKAVGYTGVLSEGSIKYSTGVTDEDGNEVYTTEEPAGRQWVPYSPDSVDTDESLSSTDDATGEAVVISEFETTSSGGGTEDLAEEEESYFTEAEIREIPPPEQYRLFSNPEEGADE